MRFPPAAYDIRDRMPKRRYYDVAVFRAKSPALNAVVFRLPTVRRFYLDANCYGSLFSVGTAPTADMTLTLRHNGTSIGTISFAAGATTGTVVSTAVTFEIGDVFDVVCATTKDLTAAALSLTFLGVPV